MFHGGWALQDTLNLFIRKSTSNGDLRRKQSNHKTDESVKIGQSVGLFGLFFFYWRQSLIKKKCNLVFQKKIFFDQKIFWPNQKNILVKNNFGYEFFFGQKYLSQFFT